MGLCKPVDGRPEKHVTFEGIQTDVVESFRYLHDEICPGGGRECPELAAQGECPELLPVLTSTTVFLVKCGKLYDSCARVTSFHASEFWSLQREEVQRLLRNERDEDNVSLSTSYGRLNLVPLKSKLRLNYLRQYGHVERSDKCINKCTHSEIDSFKGRGKTRKTWSATVAEDLKAWKIDANNAHDPPMWKKALRTAMKSPTCGNRGQVAQNG